MSTPEPVDDDVMPRAMRGWKPIIERGIAELHGDGWRVAELRLPVRAFDIWAGAKRPLDLMGPSGLPIPVSKRLRMNGCDSLNVLAWRRDDGRRRRVWAQLYPPHLHPAAEATYARLRERNRRPTTGMCMWVAHELLARSPHPVDAADLYVELAGRLGPKRAVEAAVRVLG